RRLARCDLAERVSTERCPVAVGLLARLACSDQNETAHIELLRRQKLDGGLLLAFELGGVGSLEDQPVAARVQSFCRFRQCEIAADENSCACLRGGVETGERNFKRGGHYCAGAP